MLNSMLSISDALNSDLTQEINQKLALEIVEQRLTLYKRMMNSHPLFALGEKCALSREVINEFAYLQYVDSILWVPMLALMKERVTNGRLLRAITDNLSCEAGIGGGTSHIELARRFIASIGVRGSSFGYITPDVVESASHWTSFNEAQIAGWLCAAEALVPLMFSKMRACFARIDGCDLTYIDEHISVDGDEHSAWMLESVKSILDDTTRVQDVLAGLDFGMREAMDVPDSLYAKASWLIRK